MVDKFKEFLEEKLTRSEAETILGLGNSYSIADVKQARNSAIKTAHPDKGGTLELSKKINTAYDVLKGKSSASSGSDFNSESTAVKYRTMAVFINNDLLQKFQPDAFIKYFEGIFKQKFTHKLEMRWADRKPHPYHAGFVSTFSTDDNKIVFEFQVTVSLTEVVYQDNNSLSNDPDISYELGVTAFGYAKRKKQKMSQRSYKQMNNHSVLWEPKKSFPAAKMKKIADASGSVKMKRADFQLAMEKEVKAKSWSDSMLIPLKDGNYFQVYRIVFMRQPMWQLARMGKLNDRLTRFIDFENISGSLPENETTLDTFLALKKLNMAQATKLLDKEYKKYIGK